MKTAQCLMQREHVPPGFWPWPGDELMLVDGVELESAVPTRFFQTVDAYPRRWGRLSWRVQLNKIVEGRAGLPLFRSFYPGVEWNLHHPDYRWFLTAWFEWERRAGERGEPRRASATQIDGDTVLFPIPAPDPEFDGSLYYLRSRVDARGRRGVAEAVRSQREQAETSDPAVILLDDVIDLRGTSHS